MAQRLVTPFVNTVTPGAYPNITVQSNPVALGSSGNVVIIGEADGGPSYQTIVLKNNVFAPNQFAKVQQIYLSGQIVDAMAALASASADPDIVGAPNSITILKTNRGTQASALIDTDYGTLKDQNFGKPGNQYKFNITQTEAESAPTVTGTVIAAFGAALNGANFTLRVNGGALATVTLSNVAGDHDTIAHLVTELASLLPGTVIPSLGVATNTLKLSLATDASANHSGSGRSFELIDATPGDLASLGLPAGLVVSAQEPEIEVDITRADINLSETFAIQAAIALRLGYVGTTATVTINQTAKTLVTTVTGGSGTALSIDLSQYSTIADLAAYISAQPGYFASSSVGAQQLPTSILDTVSALPIATSTTAQAGRIKMAAYNFQKAIATSRGVQFAPQATAGLPLPSANPAFLSGGTRGATLGADIAAAIQQLAGINVNIVIPLFSQDASLDIAAGETDSNSTYTIAAINASIKNHCLAYSTPLLKKNRIAVLSSNDTYANSKAMAQSLSQYRISLAVQKCTQENPVTGQIETYQPWYAACVAAGMQTAGFYKSITNKQANVISFIDPDGFDSGNPGDVEDALLAGLLIMSNANNAPTWVSDQSTYSRDTNFVYNSIQAVYCSDILALDLAASFQAAFVGKSVADVDKSVALAFLSQKMKGYKDLKLIASSDDAPAGFKNPDVQVVPPSMLVSVDVKLATAIYFIPINVNFSQVVQQA